MGHFNPAIHHRRSIRLRGHDYSAGGTYFVTLCVADRRPLFGTIVNGRMALNDAGRAAMSCWRAIPSHFPQAVLDEWIVMPDHVHGIIVVGANDYSPVHAVGAVEGANNDSPLHDSPIHPPQRPHGTTGTLGSIIRGFKIGVTKWLGGDSPWQRNYYDIIIRDARAMNAIRRYIRDNPAHVDALRYGEPRFCLGDRALLDLPMTAFLASRTRESFVPPIGSWLDRPVCMIGGFLSPMERTVFDACLAEGLPLVWVLARGLPNRFPLRIVRAIDNGRLLVMTPFEATIEGFSAARAAWCNQFSLHLATNAVIGRLSPDGMLACLLADLGRDIPVIHLESLAHGGHDSGKLGEHEKEFPN